MPLKIITLGDSTDHGGKVISGSSTHDIGGKAIARLGDEVMCPQRYPGGASHGKNKIITAHETLYSRRVRQKTNRQFRHKNWATAASTTLWVRHAKVAIVDDAAFTIGSADLNLRSMALDSELNILSEAKDVAF